MSIRFICDSTCDYTTEQAASLGITLVPLKVLFGEKEYFDGVDMKPEEFYDKLASAEELPTTSQPSPEAFLQYFREAKEAGDDVICILLAKMCIRDSLYTAMASLGQPYCSLASGGNIRRIYSCPPLTWMEAGKGRQVRCWISGW